MIIMDLKHSYLRNQLCWFSHSGICRSMFSVAIFVSQEKLATNFYRLTY